MSDVHRCDRIESHDGLEDALFTGQAPFTIQTPRGRTLELCPDCAEAFEDWWTGNGDPGAEGDTIGDKLE